MTEQEAYKLTKKNCMKETEYQKALEECRILFLEKCGEMNLAHYRALTNAFNQAYKLGLKHAKIENEIRHGQD